MRSSLHWKMGRIIWRPPFDYLDADGIRFAGRRSGPSANFGQARINRYCRAGGTDRATPSVSMRTPAKTRSAKPMSRQDRLRSPSLW